MPTLNACTLNIKSLYLKGLRMSSLSRVLLICFLLSPSFLFAYELQETFTEYMREFSGKNFFLALLLFFTGGLLTNLTPCVYPLIPITLSIFQVKKFNDSGRRKLFPLFYSLGIFVTFFLLGLLSSYFGVLFGGYFSNPYFHFFVFIFLFSLGFMMLDMINLNFIQNAVYKLPLPKSSYLYFLVSGMLSGLLSTPCTGPILGLVLLSISQINSLVLGILFMSVFSIGFSLPYVFLGYLSQSLTALPRLGKMLLIVKVTFASLMFSLGVIFLSNILPKELSQLISINAGLKEYCFVIAILSFSVLFFIFDKISLRTFKLNSVILMTLIFLFSFDSLIYKEERSTQKQTELSSHGDMSLNKRITLVLFTSSGCHLCDKIINRLKDIESKVNILKIDLSESNLQNRRLMEHYKILGVPTLFVFKEKPKDLLKEIPLKRYIGEMKIKNLIDNIKIKDYKDFDQN